MKNKKLILGLLVAGAVGYYFYKKNKNKSIGATSSFSGDDGFFNFGEIGQPKTKETGIVQAGTRSGESIGQTSCEVVQGNVGYVGMALSNNRIIVRTGNGTTLICPRGQRSDLPR